KVYLNTGNGFSGTSVNWSLPAGGQIDGGVNQGFNLLSAIGYDTNSDTWSTVDINGDSKPDLVCTGTRAANGYVTEFSPGNNSYWKVYLNTGNGFSGTSVNWSLPAGGQIDGGVNQGFNLLSAIGYDTNSDTWSTVDINGDGKPDLVCTGTRAAN
ncbi:MAG: VCBS repeat-containing protein, partial [Flavobacteriales bacterium]|nr:VCBS repeat-containing protein [Flavobacteriales bacterium]